MNKSYKTIWNESLGAWVAASELATGRSKSSRSRKATRAVLAAGILLQAGAMAPSVAVAGALDGGTTAAADQQAYGYKAQVTTDAPAMAIGSNVSAGAGQAIAIGNGVRVYMRNVHLRVPDVDWEWERYRFLPMMNAVAFGDCTVELRTDEFDLATELFRHTGHTLTRQQLCMAIWGHDGHDKSRSLDACASRLRRALQLEENGWKLRAVWGAGYRLDGPSQGSTTSLKVPDFEVS